MATKYDNIKVGDKIFMPKTLLKIKGGTIVKIRKHNQHALRVELDNGGKLELSRYIDDFEIQKG